MIIQEDWATVNHRLDSYSEIWGKERQGRLGEKFFNAHEVLVKFQQGQWGVQQPNPSVREVLHLTGLALVLSI